MHCLMLTGMFLLSTAVAAARFYHVAPHGNDQAPGDMARPLASIQRAADLARSGDTVMIEPGIYAESVTFPQSGEPEAPITFQGRRGPDGAWLSIIESGVPVSGWQPAPETGPELWQAPVPFQPELVTIDGKMIVLIHSPRMALPRTGIPAEIDEPMIWDEWGEGCRRLSGFDLLNTPSDILVSHRYFRGEKVPLWATVGGVMCGFSDGKLFIRFSDGNRPENHRIVIAAGPGFTADNRQNLIFRDLWLRASRCQILLSGPKCSGNLVENCLLMHGGLRISVAKGAHHNRLRGNVGTLNFRNSQVFGLRHPGHMSPFLAYLVFKYIIGSSHSDDTGIRLGGPGNLVEENIMDNGLIGIDVYAPDNEVAGNVIRGMSSVGLCTNAGGGGRFHHNLIENCGIPLRIHAWRHHPGPRVEYHHHNLFIQRPGSGSQIFVHCSSHLPQFADAVNFSQADGQYRYLEQPPAPVVNGPVWIVHNTFYGGEGATFNIRNLSRRFRQPLPFHLLNNLMPAAPRLAASTHASMEGNLLYHFPDTPVTEFEEPALTERNPCAAPADFHAALALSEQDGLPLLLVRPEWLTRPPADLSTPFTLNGIPYPPLPGLPATGLPPRPGALNGDPAQSDHFRKMFRRAEEVRRKLATDAR